MSAIDPQERRDAGQRSLHPLPRGLVELYGLLAVVVVLIPEWLADGTISIGQATGPESLPMRSRAWSTVPELCLAAMNLRELRQLARQLRVVQYGACNREQLSTRLLRRMKGRNAL